MGQTKFDILFDHVILKLKDLSPALSYHSINHTIDVIRQAERIANDEGINEKELYLLKVAALYHDTGFLVTYADHEMKSCSIFEGDCTIFNFNDAEKELILNLIMATKMPQKPRTLLQKIICDADLDYLGRNDFPEISLRLKNEFMHYGIISDDQAWQKLQLTFLQDHHFHTRSSQLLRQPVKMNNLSKLIQIN